MKYRIVNKTRFFIFCLTVCLLAGLTAAALFSHASAVDKKTYQKIEVKPGETLWSIAAEYGDPDEDIRNTICDIQKLNGLSGSLIYAGQTLTVPCAPQAGCN